MSKNAPPSTAPQPTKPAELVKVQMNAPVTNGTTCQALLEQYRSAFEIAGAKHLDVDRMIRVALMAVSRQTSLLECTSSSLLGAMMMAAQLGLDIGAKEAYLVPFRNKHAGNRREVQLIPDYRGVAKLIRNSGLVTNIEPEVVYKEDFFEYELGATPKLVHKPKLVQDRSKANIIATYSVATFKDGLKSIDVLPMDYVRSIEEKSKAADGPWKGSQFDYAEMCKKTAIKHHSKRLPMDVNSQLAVNLDNRAELARPQSIELFHDKSTGRLLAEIPPEPEDDSQSETQLPEGSTGKVLDNIVKDSKKDKGSKAEAKGEPKPDAPSIDESLPDIVEDQYTVIYDAMAAAGVKLADVTAHMQKEWSYPEGCKVKSLKQVHNGSLLAWLMLKKQEKG